MTETRDPFDVLISRVERSSRTLRYLLIMGEFLGVGSFVLSGYKEMQNGGRRIFDKHPVKSTGIADQLFDIFSREEDILKPLKHVSQLTAGIMGLTLLTLIFWELFLLGAGSAPSNMMLYVCWSLLFVAAVKGVFTFFNPPYYAMLNSVCRRFDEDMSLISGFSQRQDKLA